MISVLVILHIGEWLWLYSTILNLWLLPVLSEWFIYHKILKKLLCKQSKTEEILFSCRNLSPVPLCYKFLRDMQSIEDRPILRPDCSGHHTHKFVCWYELQIEKLCLSSWRKHITVLWLNNYSSEVWWEIRVFQTMSAMGYCLPQLYNEIWYQSVLCEVQVWSIEFVNSDENVI